MISLGKCNTSREIPVNLHAHFLCASCVANNFCMYILLLSYEGCTFGAAMQTPFAKMHHDFDLEKPAVYLGYVIFAKVNNQRKLILALH